MRVYPIGRTGQQCNKIFPGYCLHGGRQRLQIVLVDHGQNLIHLIGKYFIQYMYIKTVPRLHLIQVRKKLCTGQSPVSGQDAVTSRPADGQPGSLQMTDTGL